jgi:hypothetical protein
VVTLSAHGFDLALPPRSGSSVAWMDWTSAISKDMLAEWFQAFASEVLMDPVHELVRR